MSSLARSTSLSALFVLAAAAQTINLADRLAAGKLQTINREVTKLAGTSDTVHFNEKAEPGIAWIQGSDFSEGAIEVEVRGRDLPQQSFVGVAFHGTDGQRYECVYLRPFNFRAEDPVRHVHAVQYMAAPDYDWPRLRQEFPEKFEHSVDQSLDPNGWVDLRITVTGETVQVYVGHVTAPTLKIHKLGGMDRGMIGLWMGNNSGGDFRNLQIIDRAGKVSGISRGLRHTLWAILFWTGLGLFFSSQLVLAGIHWKEALAFTMPRWYAWGLLTPLVIRIDRRFGSSLALRRRVAIHIPLGVAFTLLCITIRLVSRPLRGSAPPQSIEQFFLERFYWDLLIYAVIAGVAVSRDYARQARDRERQAHELAVQATDLERRLAESRLQALRAQLHPHFLFNALNTISAFTETNPRAARRLMEQLGDLLRASLTHTSRPFVTLGEELTIPDDYLALISARFEGRITVSVRAEDDLLDCMVPSFLLQPLVENAIRHGLALRLAPGEVEVTATRNADLLQLRVSDNGVGFEQLQCRKVDSTQAQRSETSSNRQRRVIAQVASARQRRHALGSHSL